LDGLRRHLQDRISGTVKTELAMRYGEPSIQRALDSLRTHNLRKLIILPLYPQYSATTSGSVFDEVVRCLQRWRWVPSLEFTGAYHDHPVYIKALARKIATFREQYGCGEHLLMSFHGVPKRYLLAGDPYYCHCHKTARLLAAELDLDEHQWSLVFQSRFGREEWLRPYCDDELKRLAKDNVKSVDVICPGFASDCLETLEEIDLQYRKLFLDSGGEQFNYIPCLNDDAAHIGLLANLVMQCLPHMEQQSGTGPRRDLAKAAGAEH